MNKKILFIISIILVSLLFAGGVGYLIYNLTNYSDTMEVYEQIENDKTLLTSKADQFENKAEKYTNIPVSERTYDGTYSIEQDGVRFISFVHEWDEDDLEDLADEFFRNVHGEELQYLQTVELHKIDYDYELYEYYDRDYRIPLTFYDFIGSKESFTYTTECGSIMISGSEYIEDMTLMGYFMSIGYGNHFVRQNMDILASEDDVETEYYALRAEGNDEIKLEEESYNDEIENFQWYLENIAIMDYMYFMGSETMKGITEFYDTEDILDLFIAEGDSIFVDYTLLYDICLNGLAHENYELLMPHQVEGLREYFFSFVEDEAPEYTMLDEEIGDLNLKYEPVKGTSYNKGKITFDKPFEDEDVVYTVLILNENDNLMFMHKTINGDEEAEAILGTIAKRGWQIDTGDFYGFSKGEPLKVRVTITFPDGTVVVSDAIDIIYKEGMKE